MASTLYQSAYDALRASLIVGKFAPGEKLKVAEIAKAQGVSAAGVREALSRLTAEGFAESEPQKGFRVAPISLEDLLDLTEIRIQIECECLSRSIENGTLQWESAIVAAVHRLSKLTDLSKSRGGEPFDQAWRSAHFEFHYSLVAACPSAWYLRMREQLWWQSERFRALSVTISGGDRDIRGEHEALAQSVLSRDTETAKTLLRQHLMTTAEALLVS